MHRPPQRRFRRLPPVARSPCALLRPFLVALAVLFVWVPLHLAAQDPGADPSAEPAVEQSVTGVVSEADGRPVLGALVAVEDDEGRRLRSTLTDEAGRFRIPVAQPGTYRLRVERLGYRALVTEAFTVAAGQVLRHDVEVTGEPIALAQLDVVVEAAQRGCVLEPEQGALLANLWEQARQAFRRVAVTDEEEGGYRFHLRRYERVVELPTARVVQERWREPSTSLQSFQSPPAEVLLRDGWVQMDADGNLVYYGPNLQVLLSEEFQAAHCLELRWDGASPGRVGVAFEPVGRERAPGIRGTLWMDRETVELQRLEFHFTRHLHDRQIPHPLLELFGGEMEFRALPDGRWVVDQWVLRVPRFRPTGRPVQWASPQDPELRERLERIRRVVERAPRAWQEMVEGSRLLFWEEGGTLARVETPGGTSLPARGEAALEGVVWDSLQGPGADRTRAPLEGAEIRLEGTQWEATTDAQGRFRLEVPVEGSYELTFHHPVMDSLRLAPPDPVSVVLRPGLAAEVELALPSRATVLARGCEGQAQPEGSGILVGTVLDEALRVPVGGATVLLRPQVQEQRAGEDPPPTFTTRAAGDGTYRFCQVPAGTWYDVTAQVADREGPARRLMVPAAGRIVDLDAWADQGQRGRIAGRVTEGARGPGVADAYIVLEGPERRTVYADGRGRFELREVAPGAYSIRVEHVAFRAVDGELEIPAGGAEVELEVNLQRDAIALEPIVATVEARSPRLERAGFYDRQRTGFGTFITRDVIERRNPVAITHLFNAVPRAQQVGERVLFRGSEAFGGLDPVDDEMLPCFPEVYVDGVWWGKEYSLNYFNPDEVEAIEAYTSAARIPIQYNTADSACGVILIWLRDGSDVGRER
jgi:protocatechuate 3,4-dioxygenase beta subunit